MVEREEDCDDQRGGLAEPANMAGEVPTEKQLFCDGATKPLNRSSTQVMIIIVRGYAVALQ